ncbi:MAG: hypothetical protein ACRC3Y_18095 [Romboutsia sp.]|uniref:hypothetical protein n=1 Tax=Romboutsia sp. TaxID=1965302 RepID=UPI003F37C98E
MSKDIKEPVNSNNTFNEEESKEIFNSIDAEFEDKDISLNQLSFNKDKGKPKTIAVASDVKTRKIFDSVLKDHDGHEKIVTLMKAFEEKVAREKRIAFVDNVDMINRCIETVAQQVKAMSIGLATEEARMKSEYIDRTRAQLAEVMGSYDTIIELTDENGKLSETNEKLNNTVEDLRLNIKKLEEEVECIIILKNDLISENNELLKNQNKYKDNLDAVKKSYEDKIGELVSNVAELNDKLSIMTTKYNQVKEDNAKLEGKMDELSVKYSSEIESLRTKLEEERISSVRKDADIKSLESTNAVHKKDLVDMQKEIESLDKENNKLSGDNHRHVTALTAYADEIEELKKNISGHDEAIKVKNDEILNIGSRCKQLTSDLEDITLKLKTAELESESYKGQFDSSIKKQNETESVLHETKNKLADEEKKTFKLEFELNAMKLKYDELLNEKKEAKEKTIKPQN